MSAVSNFIICFLSVHLQNQDETVMIQEQYHFHHIPEQSKTLFSTICPSIACRCCGCRRGCRALSQPAPSLPLYPLIHTFHSFIKALPNFFSVEHQDTTEWIIFYPVFFIGVFFMSCSVWSAFSYRKKTAAPAFDSWVGAGAWRWVMCFDGKKHRNHRARWWEKGEWRGYYSSLLLLPFLLFSTTFYVVFHQPLRAVVLKRWWSKPRGWMLSTMRERISCK